MAYLKSPKAYIDDCNYFGEEVNPVKLNQLWENRIEKLCLKQLLKTCELSGRIAVNGQIMSRKEREKFKENRYPFNGKAYYLFPFDQIPLYVFIKINPKQDQLIYEINQSTL